MILLWKKSRYDNPGVEITQENANEYQHAEADFGKFRLNIVAGRQYKDGTRQFMARVLIHGDAFTEATLVRVRGHLLDAINATERALFRYYNDFRQYRIPAECLDIAPSTFHPTKIPALKDLNFMPTLKERDEALEKKWAELEDIPIDADTEKLEAPFMHFPVGTDREEIWQWFDQRHSKGIVHLLYHEGIEHYPELEKLFHRHQRCFNCDSETCALNPEGVCLHPLLYGTVPEYLDDEGCKGFIMRGDDLMH